MRGKQTLIGFAARAHFASPFPITGDLFLIPLFVVGIRIRVVLHIYHHPVIQHHIEKYSAFSAKNPPHKQRIRYPQAAKRIFRAADKQIPVHNPVKQPPAPGDAAALAGRRTPRRRGRISARLRYRLCSDGTTSPPAPRSPRISILMPAPTPNRRRIRPRSRPRTISCGLGRSNIGAQSDLHKLYPSHPPHKSFAELFQKRPFPPFPASI